MLPTAERVRELLDYDQETGVMTWRVARKGSALAGTQAGSLSCHGYRRIRIDGKLSYMAHRLAWLHVTGAWPIEEVDHIDGDRNNNAFSNLRDVSKTLNQHNRHRARSDSGTGIQGVQQVRSGKYIAGIHAHNEHHHLGTFDTIEEAALIRAVAKAAFHGSAVA